DGDRVGAARDGGLGHREVVGQDSALVVLAGSELDDGAAAEPEHLVHRHGSGAEHDRDVERDLVDGGHQRTLGSVQVLKSSRDGYEPVNERGRLTAGLRPAADLDPVEWAMSDGLVPYEQARAVMDQRRAARATRRAA